MMNRWVPLAAILLVVLGACSSAPKDSGDPQSGPLASDDGDAPPTLPELASESTNERQRRVVVVEQSLDNFYAAWVSSENREAHATLKGIRTYVREHFDRLMSDAQTGTTRFRRVAVWALGFSARQEAVPVLMSALQDPEPDVVLHSLLGLSQMRRKIDAGTSPETVNSTEDLVPLAPEKVVIDPRPILPFLTSPIVEIRRNASLAIAFALRPEEGPTTDNTLVLSLVSAFSDADGIARSHVALALGRALNEQAFPILLRGLKDPVPLVRIRSVLGLGRLGSLEAVPYIIEALAARDAGENTRKWYSSVLRDLLGEENLTSTRAEDWRVIARSRGLL